MPKTSAIISSSWTFCFKQQAIMHVGFWFLFLPVTGMMILDEVHQRYESLWQTMPEMLTLTVLAYVVLALVMTWGMVCIFSIGKRLLQAKSGRTRTSFKAVRAQARAFFIPYLLTSILRDIFTTLWTLLLIVPGVIYFIRTVFFPVVVVCEGISYRAALQRSKDVVAGQFGQVFWAVLVTGIITMLVPQFCAMGFAVMAKDAPWPIVVAGGVASGIVLSMGVTLYLLSLIQLYGYFRPSKAPTFN